MEMKITGVGYSYRNPMEDLALLQQRNIKEPEKRGEERAAQEVSEKMAETGMEETSEETSEPAKVPSFGREAASLELSQQGLAKAADEDGYFMEKLDSMESAIEEALSMEELGGEDKEDLKEKAKCMDIARRIAKGDKVSPSDEKKLREFDANLYTSSKNLAMLKKPQASSKKQGKPWSQKVEKKETEASKKKEEGRTRSSRSFGETSETSKLSEVSKREGVGPSQTLSSGTSSSSFEGEGHRGAAE